MTSPLYPATTCTLRSRGRLILLEEPVVMGILNLSPDSFYDGGHYSSIESARARARKMLEEGAAIIDVGACSSRPGSLLVTQKEELERLVPVLHALQESYPETIISVDTFRPAVAKIAVEECGVSIINDISGGSWEEGMLDTVAALQVPYVMMHAKDKPEVMQYNPVYEDIFKEIIDYFARRISYLKSIGFTDVIIDPGFGFGKTVEHNYMLLQGLENFHILGHPILAGLSRKSMIRKVLGVEATGALNGTVVLQTVALLKGAKLIRTHDVREAKESIRLLRALSLSGSAEFVNFAQNQKSS